MDGTNERRLNLIWLPTFRCNLSCAYCAARALPTVTHGNELPASTWIDIFDACPNNIEQVAITGGEPSVYHGLDRVISAGKWQICIDSNLRIHPEKWLVPDAYARVRAVNAGLQFDADHPEVASYWEHIAWLRETLPDAQIVCANVHLWRELPERWERAKERSLEIGVEYRPQTFDATYLWKEHYPQTPGRRESCSSGYSSVVVLPDGAVYRCIGHAYFKVGLLGNLRNGWDCLLDAPAPCETLFCTACDQEARTAIDMTLACC